MQTAELTTNIKDAKHYPIWLSTKEYKKLLCIMSHPEYKIWYKDEEITSEQLLEILNK
jgi:hypothetical protein